MSLYIESISIELPAENFSNREFCFWIPEDRRPLGFSEEWISSRCGIHSRRVWDRDSLGTHKVPFEILSRHLDALLTKMKVHKNEPLILLYSHPKLGPTLRDLPQFKDHTSVQFRFQPSTGLIQILEELQKTTATERTHIVAIEALSPFWSTEDVGSSMLFGDLIAGLTLSVDPTTSIFKIGKTINNPTPDTENLLHFSEKDSSFSMKGTELFRFVIESISKQIEQLLTLDSRTEDSIDYVIPHQANQRILDRLERKLALSNAKWISTLKDFGNTSSASLILTLHEYLKATPPQNSTLLLTACGYGLTTGSALLFDERKVTHE